MLFYMGEGKERVQIYTASAGGGVVHALECETTGIDGIAAGEDVRASIHYGVNSTSITFTICHSRRQI